MKVIPGGQGSLDLDEILARPLFAFLGTASPNGPRVSPVWFLWECAATWVQTRRRGTRTGSARQSVGHIPSWCG